MLDENVRAELGVFLSKAGFDVKAAPRGAADEVLAALSKKECRILITNDRDFCLYPSTKIFAVIWLRIPEYSRQQPKDIEKDFYTQLIADSV